MEQGIIGRIGRKIAGLGKLKQIGHKSDAGGDALAKQGKLVRQKDKPADQPANGQHDDKRRKYPANPSSVEFRRREGAGSGLVENDAGDQEAGNNEKDVDADKPAGNQPRVISDHQQNGDRSQTVDVGAIRKFVVFAPGPNERQSGAPPPTSRSSAYYRPKVMVALYYPVANSGLVAADERSLKTEGSPKAAAKQKGRREPAFSLSKQTRSVARGDRAAPAEAIVHADLDGMLVIAEPGADDVGGTTGEGSAAEIVILVFDLGGPAWREHVFQTGADGIAVPVASIGREGHGCTAHTSADIVVIAPGVTALGVEQRRAPSVAEPAGDRAKLVVVGGDQRATRKQHAIIVAAEPVVLGFGTDDPVGCELVIDATLHAAHKAAGADLQAVIAGERTANVAADVESGPVIDNFRRREGRSFCVGAGRQIGRHGGSRESDEGGCAEQ